MGSGVMEEMMKIIMVHVSDEEYECLEEESKGWGISPEDVLKIALREYMDGMKDLPPDDE